MAEFIPEIKYDYKKISNKIKSMIKNRIEELGLIKTGRLLNSINVKVNKDGSFQIIAEDYFTELDEQYNISKFVFDSTELQEFIQKDIAKQLEDHIAKYMNLKVKNFLKL